MQELEHVQKSLETIESENNQLRSAIDLQNSNLRQSFQEVQDKQKEISDLEANH